MFAACDDDKSGYLSIAEFKQLAETNGDAQFAEFVFGTMDSAAADGRLSITEFVTNNLEPEMSDADFAERTATWLKLAESRVVGAGDGGQSLPLPLLRLKAVVEGRADDTLGASATIAEAHRAERPLLLREFLQALVTIAARSRRRPARPAPPARRSAPSCRPSSRRTCSNACPPTPTTASSTAVPPPPTRTAARCARR